MKDPLGLVKLPTVMRRSSGNNNIAIGLIDGPVNLAHPDFEHSQIRTVKYTQMALCKNASSMACMHGTFNLGILSAMRGTKAPGICPNCRVLIYPFFKEPSKGRSQTYTSDEFHVLPIPPKELSYAIVQTIDAGARIINLSLGLSSSLITSCPEIYDAYDYAAKNNVIIVAATGNKGMIGSTFLLSHPWVTPVVACNERGIISPTSNYGPSIANRGLMAPGVDIVSTSPDGQYTQASGTSVATPFVTGTIALLWSLFPNTSAAQLLYSIRNSAKNRRGKIIPPLLNAETLYDTLKAISKPT